MIMKWMKAGLLFAAVPIFAAVPFNCEHGRSLQVAIDCAAPGETLQLSGTCSGPLLIKGKSLTLAGKPGAVVDGSGQDAITVIGPAHVTLSNLTVQNGQNGINASGGAELSILNTKVQKNKVMGILLSGASSAALSGAATDLNGVNGIDAEGSSASRVNGSYESSSNGVFGVNINGSSSFTLSGAQVSVSQNTLGIQIGTSASAFISDAATTVNVSRNVTTGLTIVSGAHMVDFGGAINTTGNGVHGVSVDSKAGLDLDAAATLTSSGNAQDGVHLEETSVLTMFNTTAFSGAPGTTTINSQNNLGNGISILTGSNLTVIHQAALNSTGNAGDGIQVDNGSGLTLIQSNVTSNSNKDIVLTFGSRADVSGTTFGILSCDATVLVRGGELTCPK